MLIQFFYTTKLHVYTLGLLLIAVTSAYQQLNNTHEGKVTIDLQATQDGDVNYQSLTANMGNAIPFWIDGKENIHKIIGRAQALAKSSDLHDLWLILINLEYIQTRVKELAEALSTIPNLQTLTIRLARQDVSSVKILAEILKHMSRVNYLNLSANNLHDKAFTILAPSLKHISNLQKLNLSDNNLQGLVDYWKDLPDMPHLQTIDLAFNNLSNEGIQALAQTLRSMPHLRNLNILYNGIGDSGVEYLAEALPYIHDLQKLELSHNEIGTAGILSLSKVLRQHPFPNLSYLSLAANCMDNQSGKVFGELLSFIPCLQELDVSYTHGIGDPWFRAFAKAIEPTALHDLQFLDLIATNMGDSGLAAVIKILKQTPNLKTLRLSDNHVQTKGMKRLAKMIQVHPMPHLEQLQVSGNNIKSQGMQALVKALQAHSLPSLQVLYLDGDDIRDEGLIALAQAFDCMPYLQELHIASNSITDQGVKILDLLRNSWNRGNKGLKSS